MSRERTAIRKLNRLGGRRLLRAHLALAARPTLRSQLASLCAPVAKALSARLGTEVQLRASLLEASFVGASALSSPAAFALLSLDQVGQLAVLELDLGLASALVDRLAGGPGEPGPALPLTEAEQAGATLLLLEAVAALRQTPLEPRLAPRLVRLLLSAAEVSAALDLRQPHLGVALELSCGPALGRLRLLLPGAAVHALVEEAPPEARPLAPEVGAARLALALRAGAASLRAEDWVFLAPGDVILFDALRRQRSGPVGEAGALLGPARLVGATFSLAGELSAEGFALRACSAREHAMSDKTEILRPAEVPVELELELAKVRISLAELGALQPGSVIGLRIGAGEPVTLRVGDRAVAVAELVDIEGEVGARILRLIK